MVPSNNPTNRNIPEPIKREVRQRCGFGCVICGLPLYEYEHMLGWAAVRRHVASEITLLCKQHHQERTNGLLPIQVVVNANNNPYNLRTGISNPYLLHYADNQFEANIGSNKFMWGERPERFPMFLIGIDGMPLVFLNVQDGNILLNIILFDEMNEIILEIRDNQLIYKPTVWDINFVGRNLILRQGQGDILFDIIFEVPNRVIINRGRFLLNGMEILVRPEYIYHVNNPGFVQGSEFVNCDLCFSAGADIGNLGFPAINSGNATRYPRSRSDIEREEREKLAELERMRQKLEPR